MTLAFELAALRRFPDPGAVLEDARSWATHVGVVSDAAPERISRVASRTGIELDFASTATGASGGLAVLRQQYPTWRHVVVGTTDEHREAARSHGWEYLPVEAAAEKAGWDLDPDGRWRGSPADREDEGP